MNDMTTMHGRRLGLSGVPLTKARNNRFGIQALSAVRNKVEAVLDESGYLVGAAFSWVTIAVRYGLIAADAPVYRSINKKPDPKSRWFGREFLGRHGLVFFRNAHRHGDAASAGQRRSLLLRQLGHRPKLETQVKGDCS